jgi:hypothetical protein
MGYVENNLLPNEEITYHARLHWIIYALPAVVFVIAILLVLGGGGWIAGSVLGVIAFVLFLPPWIKASSSEFAITNKRVLIKVGLIRRHSLELLLQKVEGIGVDQGILGRILGYGTITVAGVGGTKEAFRMISNPHVTRDRQISNPPPSSHLYATQSNPCERLVASNSIADRWNSHRHNRPPAGQGTDPARLHPTPLTKMSANSNCAAMDRKMTSSYRSHQSSPGLSRACLSRKPTPRNGTV